MAPFPDWVMLDRFVVRRDDLDVDNPTVASGSGSADHAIHVGFQLLAPPRVSRILLRVDAGASSFNDFRVVAAHRDALLLQMSHMIAVHCGRTLRKYAMIDFFLFSAAGTGGSSRPSLDLLPGLDGTEAEIRTLIESDAFVMTNQRERRSKGLDLGVVRRGEKDFAVAELQISWSNEPPQLHVFCPSRSSQWEITQPALIPVGSADDVSLQRMLFYWNADKVVTFGSSICWIDYCYGIIFCDVFDDIPVLYYKEFPAKVPNLYDNCHGTGWVDACQTVGVTSCGSMKYITVVRDDGEITGDFKHFHPSSFTVTSWTLRRTEVNKMEWEKTDEVTSDDLWCLDGFQSLPRTPLQFPHISMDDPNVVCFVLSQRVEGKCYSESWVVSIDLSNKVVKASHPYANPELEETDISLETDFSKTKYWYFESFLPTEFTKYLNLLRNRTDLIRNEPRPGKRKFMEGSKHLELTG
uniref:Uncharacterized protein n=1 Tax=Avena sativa TaxID=4498 RepID=A0ACD5ZYB7_AVESA